MDAEIKRKWVEALRSGRYRQTDGKLHSTAGYCCLGVLCDLMAPEDWEEDKGLFFLGNSSMFPPLSVLDDAGMGVGEEGDVPDDHPFWTLAHMNDDGKSFAEIADYIEANL